MSPKNIGSISKTFCKLFGNHWIIFLTGLIAIILFYFFREWLNRILVLYLVLLVLIGLYFLARFIAAIVRKRCRKAKADPKGQGSGGEIGAPSIKIPSHTYRRPDPLIYSQTYLMSQGLSVTWDNPDIQHQNPPFS